MKPEELLLQIREKQGFVVVGSREFLEIGLLQSMLQCQLGLARVPIRIVGPASAEEWLAQDRLSSELRGETWKPYNWRKIYVAFYRVEAAD